MDVQGAHRVLAEGAADVGRFYSAGHDLALGKGTIYSGVSYPSYHEAEAGFYTLNGLVLVLTHECDVDAANARFFASHVLVCPIIPLATLIAELNQVENDQQQQSFLTNLAHRNVFRLVYLPPGPSIDFGGILDLNRITNTHITAFGQPGAARISALTAYGLQSIEYAIQNHLLRPKEDRLMFGPLRPDEPH